MLRVYPLVDYNSDWYPKNSFDEFTRQCKNINVTRNIKDADIIWIYSYYINLRQLFPFFFYFKIFQPEILVNRRSGLEKKPVICSIHHLTPWKEDYFIRKIRQMDSVSDYIHFFSEKSLTDNRKYFNKPTSFLPYWIDTSKFFPLSEENRQRLRDKYQLPSNKLIIGSFQRDTEADGLTPKMEKGPDTFCDILQKLDVKDVLVLLAGPRREYIRARLDKSGHQVVNLGKVGYTSMNEIYNLLDYYLVTSRVEGGPQAILECMATKTKIFSTDVGVASNLSPQVICESSSDFVSAICSPYPSEVTHEHFDKVKRYFDVKKVVPMYEDWFKQLRR